MTGWEPPYDSKLWNSKKEHRDVFNCYIYALNIHDPRQIKKCLETECDLPFHQPGLISGYKGFDSNKPKTCPEMIARIIGDNSTITQIGFEEKCPPKTSKIALVVDEDEDYHFLRQDRGGWWSQKGGAKPVTNLDASLRPIWDPALANNNWTNSQGTLNYDIFCGYLCVPRSGTLRVSTGMNVNLKVTTTSQGGGAERLASGRAVTTGGRRTKKKKRASPAKRFRGSQTMHSGGRRA